jgi:hypothetical protein
MDEHELLKYNAKGKGQRQQMQQFMHVGKSVSIQI